MGLSCSCDFEPSDYDTWWEDFTEFEPLEGKRRKRCCSCNELIDVGSDVVKFFRYRHTKNVIEENIHGDAVPLAPHIMCEKCGGLYFALEELGYGCLDVTRPMEYYIEEYNQMKEED